MKGVLDRFEAEVAVILIEEDNEELHVHRETLPAKSDVNTFFHIKKHNGNYTITGIDEQTTHLQKEKSSNLMKKLRAKKKGSKFKRN